MSREEALHDFSKKRGQFRLWLGLLVPPAAWAIQIQVIYLLIENACLWGGSLLWVHIFSAVLLALSVLGVLLSWHNWIKAGGQWKSEIAGVLARSRFMAIIGVLGGALFALLIFAQWLPALMGVPCDK